MIILACSNDIKLLTPDEVFILNEQEAGLRLSLSLSRYDVSMLSLANMSAAFICLVCVGNTDAYAQDASEPIDSGFEVNAEVAVVSDYRFRGWSLSDEGPALQADASISHSSGAYVGAFVSTIDAYGGDGDGDGATVELDLYTGWGTELSGWYIDLGIMAYTYPGAEDANYYVLPISLSHSFGDLAMTGGYEYTPAQDALAGSSSGYTWLEASWPIQDLPLILSGTIGYETGAWAPGGKLDWGLGVSVPVDALELGIVYVDSDEAEAGSTLVAEVRHRF